MDISKNIISLRESKGLKQKDIAEKLGIEPPNYSRLEKRGDKLSIEQLKQIASAIGVSYTDFLEIPNTENFHEENSKKINELKKWLDDKEEVISNLRFVLAYAESAISNTLSDYYWDFMQSNGLPDKAELHGKIYKIGVDNEDIINNPEALSYFSEEDEKLLVDKVNSSFRIRIMLNQLINYCHFKGMDNFWTRNFPSNNFITKRSIKNKFVTENYSLQELDLLSQYPEKFGFTKEDINFERMHADFLKNHPAVDRDKNDSI